MPAEAAVGLVSDSNVTFAKSNLQYIGKYGTVGYKLIDFSDDFGVDAIADGGPAGSYGIAFDIGGSLFASVYAQASLSNTLSYSWNGHYTTTVTGADNSGGSFEGSPFTISTHGELSSTNSLVVANPTISAEVGAFVKAEGHASASGCVYGCVNLSLKIGNGSGTDIPLAGYNSATNTAQFLGDTVKDALPHTFETDDKIFSATINRTDFSGTVQNQAPDNGALVYSSTQQLGDVSANLAAAVADAIGVPPSVMKGDALGFSYELLGVYVGLGVDVTHSLSITPELATGYHFSDKVQKLDSLTNTWGAPTDYVEAHNDEVLTLRSLGTSDLTYVTQQYLLGKVNSAFDFTASLQDTLRILAFDGYGIDEALYDHTDKLADLGSLGSFSDTAYFNNSVYTNAGSLHFMTLGSDTLSKILGFFDNDDTFTYLKVLNYGSDCNERLRIACEIDPDFTPIITHARLDATNGNVAYSEDFTLSDALARSIEGLNGEQSDAAQRTRRLAALINTGNAGGGPIAPGAPRGAAFQAGDFALTASVPEPSSWALMIAGFGAIGTALRREGKPERRPIRG